MVEHRSDKAIEKTFSLLFSVLLKKSLVFEFNLEPLCNHAKMELKLNKYAIVISINN